MLAGAHGEQRRRVAVRTYQHRVFALEYRAARGRRLDTAHVLGRIDGSIERRDPTLGVRLVAYGGHDEQIPRTRGRHVRDALAFGLLASQFVVALVVEFLWRPAANPQR